MDMFISPLGLSPPSYITVVNSQLKVLLELISINEYDL